MKVAEKIRSTSKEFAKTAKVLVAVGTLAVSGAVAATLGNFVGKARAGSEDIAYMVPNDPGYNGSEATQYSRLRIPEFWALPATTPVNCAEIEPGSIATSQDLDSSRFVFSYGPRSAVSNHKTAAASLMAAKVNNDWGIAGIAGENCLIEDVDPSGSSIADAIRQAVDVGHAKVIDIDMTTAEHGQLDGDTKAALEYAVSQGVFVTIASGDVGADLDTNPVDALPADAPQGVWVIGATTPSGGRESNSNYGSNVKIYAPDEVPTLTATGDVFRDNEGTSFSGPEIAGLGAKMASCDDGLTGEAIGQIIVRHENANGEPDFYGAAIEAGCQPAPETTTTITATTTTQKTVTAPMKTEFKVAEKGAGHGHINVMVGNRIMRVVGDNRSALIRVNPNTANLKLVAVANRGSHLAHLTGRYCTNAHVNVCLVKKTVLEQHPIGEEDAYFALNPKK